ncbi:hypothetical protein TNCV_3325061 [Trichonephila clavipes]|nr:hypothetical protein TNCV_3325061 [Trichonephila clavipes]
MSLSLMRHSSIVRSSCCPEYEQMWPVFVRGVSPNHDATLSGSGVFKDKAKSDLSLRWYHTRTWALSLHKQKRDYSECELMLVCPPCICRPAQLQTE